MIPTHSPNITLPKFPTHNSEHHSWLVLTQCLRTEANSPAKLAVDGRFIQPGSLVFSLPPAPVKDSI